MVALKANLKYYSLTPFTNLYQEVFCYYVCTNNGRALYKILSKSLFECSRPRFVHSIPSSIPLLRSYKRMSQISANRFGYGFGTDMTIRPYFAFKSLHSLPPNGRSLCSPSWLSHTSHVKASHIERSSRLRGNAFHELYLRDNLDGNLLMLGFLEGLVWGCEDGLQCWSL